MVTFDAKHPKRSILKEVRLNGKKVPFTRVNNTIEFDTHGKNVSKDFEYLYEDVED